MTKKKLAKWGKGLIMAGVAGVGLVFSAWILVSVVQLAAAIGIAVTAWVAFPAFYEMLLYGQFTAMVSIWKGNPIYALMRNKFDFVEELGIRKKKVIGLGRSAHRTMQMLQDKKNSFPDLVAQQMPLALKQMRAYEQQLEALERAEKIVTDYDEVIDRARCQWEIAQSVNESAGILNSLGTSHRSELRELRERVAQDEIRLGTANAMAELDMLLTGMNDMKQTSAGKALDKETKPKPEVVEVVEYDTGSGLDAHLGSQKQKQGLFKDFK